MALAKVLLVEDDHFIRATLSALIAQKGFAVVGVVDTADEALHIQKIHKPEVVIADLDLGPGPNGIDIATALRLENPQLGVIILTSFSDPRLADSRVLELPQGTMYFSKSRMNDITVLLTAILQVKHMPLSQSRAKGVRFSQLTEAQIDILRLVSEGQTTASIAQQRNVSEKSVEAMLSRIHTTLELPRTKNLNPRVQLTRAFFALAGKKPPGE